MSTKADVHNACVAELEERLKQLEGTIHNLHESMVIEEKNTAGDKYETAKAMAQSEMARVTKQHELLKNELITLNQLDPESVMAVVQTGSLVHTKRYWLYISVAFGKIEIEGQEDVMVISPRSPFAQAALGKVIGDVVEFKGKSDPILAIS